MIPVRPFVFTIRFRGYKNQYKYIIDLNILNIYQMIVEI